MSKLNRYWIPFLFLCALLSACNPGRRALIKGFNSFETGDYNVAIDQYRIAMDNGVEVAESNYKVAESYRLSNRLDQAAEYYEAAIDLGVPDTAAVFHYAMALKQNGQYEEAKKQLEEYLELSEDSVLEYTEWAQQEITNLDNLDSILVKDQYFEIEPLTAVNTEEAEYAPTVFRGSFYFTSSRGSEKIYKATGTGFTNIYQAPVQGDQVLADQARLLGDEFATEGINEGAITFSPDGRMMVFARGNNGKRKGTKDVNLYMSRYQKGS